MRPGVVIGMVLCAVGALWVGQGVGWVGGSFMSGQAIWAIIGAVAIVVGVRLVIGPKRPRDRSADD